jgi:hypothetical protein
MSDRELRRYHRHYSRFHRASSLLFTLILIPCLTGLDMWALEKSREHYVDAMNAKSAHERLRERAPQVLRSEILPRARELAERSKDSKRDEIKEAADSLLQDLRKLKLAILDNLDRHEAALRGEFTDAKPLGAEQGTAAPDAREAAAKQARAFAESATKQLNRLEARIGHLTAWSGSKRQAAIDDILRICGKPNNRAIDLPTKVEKVPARPTSDRQSRVEPQRSIHSPDEFRALSFVKDAPILNLSSISTPPVQVAAAGDVLSDVLTQLQLTADSATPDTDDLAVQAPIVVDESVTAVEDLVDELKTPAAIFEHFRNEYVYEPYFGIVKGAEQTIAEKAGNDADLAAAMISVLRAAGVPCRFVYGTIEVTAAQAASWLGVDAERAPSVLAEGHIPHEVTGTAGVANILLDHIWVVAYVDYVPYQGSTAVRSGDPTEVGDTWVEIDPSFKQHGFSERRNIEFDLSMNSRALLTNTRSDSTRAGIESVAGLVTDNGDNHIHSINETNLLNAVEVNSGRLVEIMAKQGLDTTTVFRERTVLDPKEGLLPASDYYHIIARGVNLATFPTELAAQARLTVRLPSGEILLQHPEVKEPEPPPLLVADLMNAPLSIHWTADAESEDAIILAESDENLDLQAYQVRVTPDLRHKETSLFVGDAVTLGIPLDVSWTFIHAGGRPEFDTLNPALVSTSTDRISAGAETVFVCDAGRVPDTQIEDARDGIANITDLLSAIGLSYFYQADRFAQINAGVLNVLAQRVPSVTRVSYGFTVTELFPGQPYIAKGGAITTSVLRDAYSVTPISKLDLRNVGGVSTEISPAVAHATFVFNHALTSSAIGSNNLDQFVGSEDVSSTAALLKAGAKAGIPNVTLIPETDETGAITGPEFTKTDLFNSPDLSGLTTTDATKDAVVAALNDGLGVTFSGGPVSPAPGSAISQEPLVTFNPRTGDFAARLTDSGYAADLLAGAQVDLGDEAFAISDVLDSNAPALSADALALAQEWLTALPAATESMGGGLSAHHRAQQELLPAAGRPRRI